MMVAESKEPWGKLAADGKPHDYIVALTAEGGLVYDPVSRQQCTMSEFPNKKSITGILFKGA